MDLDRYVPRHSPLHRADPRLKVVAVVVLVLGITLLPPGALGAYLLTWSVLVALSTLAQLGPWRLVRGSWVVLPFAVVALPLLFTRDGSTVFTFALGPLALAITDAGIRDVSAIVLKSWLSVQAALLLAYTTPFNRLVDALRALRVPAVIVATISFMYRYLAVLVDEAGRMNRARRARSAAPPSGRGGGSLGWRARVTGAMVGSLFIRSYERSERVYAAMLARGYDGTFRTSSLPRPSDRELWLFGAALLAIATVVVLANLPAPNP